MFKPISDATKNRLLFRWNGAGSIRREVEKQVSTGPDDPYQLTYERFGAFEVEIGGVVVPRVVDCLANFEGRVRGRGRPDWEGLCLAEVVCHRHLSRQLWYLLLELEEVSPHYEGMWLEVMDQVVGLTDGIVVVASMPGAWIQPEACNLPVVAAQLPYLALVVVYVAPPVLPPLDKSRVMKVG